MICVISGALFCGLDGESAGVGQPRDEAIVNRGSGFGVIFANRAVQEVRQEEFISRHRESDGSVQPHDEATVNRGSRCNRQRLASCGLDSLESLPLSLPNDG